MSKPTSLFLTPIPESIPKEEYVIGTYLLGADRESDVIRKARSMAIEQSTGTWLHVPGETLELRERSAGRVIGIYSVPDYESRGSIPEETKLRWFVIRIAFPWINFYDNIPLLLTSLIGNISAMDNLKLLDVEFPESYTAQFKGPKFGMEGVREFLGVRDRPLLNNMIKPCTGLTPEDGADLFYEVAAGGVDWVKDDELIAGSPAFSPLSERVAQYMAAATKADTEKGEKTLYTVNITDEHNRLLDNALGAIESGANALMINIFTTGFSGCRILAENPEVNVPIMAHNCFSGTMVSSPSSGISSTVGAKIARLSGADIYLDYVPSVKFGGIEEKFIRIIHTCLAPMHDIKPSMPHLGGGVTPGVVPYLLNHSGFDVAIGAGGGIHGHPDGPRAGARAMRQAIDAAVKGVDLEDAARENIELATALDVWGVHGSENQRKLFALS